MWFVGMYWVKLTASPVSPNSTQQPILKISLVKLITVLTAYTKHWSPTPAFTLTLANEIWGLRKENHTSTSLDSDLCLVLGLHFPQSSAQTHHWNQLVVISQWCEVLLASASILSIPVCCFYACSLIWIAYLLFLH